MRSTAACCARTTLTIALVLAPIILIPAIAHAQGFLGSGIVFDPTNFVRNVLHYARRIEQMNLQRQQLQQQVIAMQKLRNPNWRQINVALTQIDALLRDSQALGYSLKSIDAEFRRTFPGPVAFRDYPSERRGQATRTLATLRVALDAANRAAQDMPAAVARLEAIKRQLGSVRGHEEALELTGTIGMYSAEELTMLRQSVAALTNVQAVVAAEQVNTKAQEQATVRARLTAMSGPGPRYQPISLRLTP